MLDTGAQPNILKKECINNNIQINYEEIIQLTGITENVVNTIGSITAHISGVPVIFHVVTDDFPIITQGILGSSFFTEHNACINYGNKLVTWRNCAFPFKVRESIILPPRANIGFAVRVANPEIKTGYLPNFSSIKGVFAGNSLVTCINDKAYVRVTNTLERTIEVTIPTVTLTEVADIASIPRSIQAERKESVPQCDRHKGTIVDAPASPFKASSVDEKQSERLNETNNESEKCSLESSNNKLKISIKTNKTNTNAASIDNNHKNKNKKIRVLKHNSPVEKSGSQTKIVDYDRHPSKPNPIIDSSLTNQICHAESNSLYTHKNDKDIIHIHTSEINYFGRGSFTTLGNDNNERVPVLAPFKGDPSDCPTPTSAETHFSSGRGSFTTLGSDNDERTPVLAPLNNPSDYSSSNLNHKSSPCVPRIDSDENINVTDTSNCSDIQIDNSYADKCSENSHKSRKIKKIFNKRDVKIIKEENQNRIETIVNSLRLEHLNITEKQNVIELVRRHSDRFYINGEYLGKTSAIAHKIITSDETPIHERQYRFPPIHREEINKQVNDLLQKDIVTPSTSPYSSPVWIVPKRSDPNGNKKWRMVIDYRKLNEKTLGDAYPLPNICDILDQLGGAKYFSVLDLASGFHQIPMDPTDAHKTAFSTPHGHYQFSRMPFGLRNAPATFQRLMDSILTGLQGTELLVYMDDIVIYASSLREHDLKLDKLMKRLRDANLTLQPDKCEFLRQEVVYLGHVITDNGVRPDPLKLSAVKNFPVPRNLKNVRQILGLAGYYRRFIPNFSQLAKPLSDLLKKNGRFEWNENTQQAFDTLRELLCKEPILQFPDFQRDFLLTTDASDTAIAGVLSQGRIGQDLPIAYASRVLNTAEKNYSTIEKELLAIVYCVAHFRPYLYGRRFTLVTDHQPLLWLYRVKDPTSRLMRWRLKLEEYDYTVVYKTGTANMNADALSRNPPVSDTYLPVLSVNEHRHSNSKVSSVIPQSPHCQHEKEYAVFPITKRCRLEFETPMFHDDSDDDDRSDDELRRKLPQSARRSALFSDSSEELFSVPTKTPIDIPQSPHGQPEKEKEKRVRFNKNINTDINNEINTEKEINETEDCIFDPGISYLPPETLPPPEPPPDIQGSSLNGSQIYDDQEELYSDVESIVSDAEEDNLQTEPRFITTHSASCIIKNKNTTLLEQDDNIIIIVSIDKRPFDKGAQELQQAGKLPPLNELMLGRARVYPSSHAKRHIIVLPAKERRTTILDEEILKECFASLLDVMTELGLHTVSIRKIKELDDITWEEILTSLQLALSDRPATITICHGTVITPPEGDRIAIIKEHHESAVGGHKGVTKTYLRIKQKFIWKGMKKDILNYINNCHTCQSLKLVRRKTRQPMILTDTPGRAFDKVALDIVGPFKTTPRGNTYILTMQDLLTKYSLYAPLTDARAETTANAFINCFICRFGCPKGILTDQGTNFVSQLMRSIMKKFRIQHFRTTAYHPQSNGSLERSHIVLVEYIKCFISKEENWDDLIERASFSYNTSVHEGTRYTPHELVFGHLARIPSNYNREEDPETYDTYYVNLFQEIRDLQKSAKFNLVRAKERSKEYYDKRVHSAVFRANDNVFLLNAKKVDKFSKEYLGPYRVIEILDHENVRIKIGNTTRIVHANRLRKAAIANQDDTLSVTDGLSNSQRYPPDPLLLRTRWVRLRDTFR